jgi:predicted CXXCH cytochrome family protein
MLNVTMAKERVHGPLLSGDGCLTCHRPHASSGKGLLSGPIGKVCGKCHADTARRHERSETKHKPVQDGDCSACHDPHASATSFLVKKASIFEMCAECHDWQKHSTHPIGEKVKDPRNPNVTMQCLSCHRSHGTEYQHMIPFATITNLCVQCHEGFKR